LVASSLNLSNEDFLAGRLRFATAPGARAVSNSGSITAAEGGGVYLVGPHVTNGGIIRSPKGEVLLAAGQSVELVDPATPNLRVEIVAQNNRAVNLGEVLADAGRIGIFGGLVRNSGRLQADIAQFGEHGEILLRATRGVTQDPGGVLQARTFGGADSILTAVDISAGGDIRLNGDVDVGEGRIDLAAGGNIRLESTKAEAANLSGVVVSLRTTTPGKTITQAPDARIVNTDAWGGLQVFANGDVSLVGRNGVSLIEAAVGQGGDLTFNNSHIFSSVRSIQLTGGGSLVLNEDLLGTLFINGDVHAGRVTINNPTGSIEISGFAGATVSSPGPININTAGPLVLRGHSVNFDAAAVIAGEGLVRITTGGDLQLAGGPLIGTHATLQGQSLDLTIGGILTLNDGTGPGSYARIQSPAPIQLSFPNLSTGGYFVNGVEGVIRQGETGIFVGPNPAVPGQTLLLDYGAAPAP
jgi:hypothetical protein